MKACIKLDTDGAGEAFFKIIVLAMIALLSMVILANPGIFYQAAIYDLARLNLWVTDFAPWLLKKLVQGACIWVVASIICTPILFYMDEKIKPLLAKMRRNKRSN